MDFIPRYAQPFTLADAVSLDVPVITEEITRLQNSLRHLKQTQAALQEYIEAETPANADPELTKALEENKTVIGSQEERVFMLKLALTEKGIPYNSHLDLDSNAATTPTPLPPASVQPAPAIAADTSQPALDEEEGGIHL
ncbi:hypothetical protein LshimejAT787_0107840 [Lyophyllum shimeji]|uniref:Uncharacterized protein n=1 Tax=Lyophyllum shimeji TaxID=47721 RepID=A0A9P3PDD7_LYOSH|nr:hypothetical protein LshimejAT787_0107840 [Lyophyllum shimeji]